MLETDLEQLPGHALGAAKLGDLFRAEEGPEPLSEETYDTIIKNSAHYASDIWRGVGLPETEEMAQFFIHHLEGDPGALGQLHSALGRGRSLALSMRHFGGSKGLFDEFVYSQLEIKDL